MTNQDNDQWQEKLTPEQYRICRLKGTEAPFTGQYYDHHEEGMYKCIACGEPLFESGTKFESGSGWPSFYQPANEESIGYNQDSSHGMLRTEVTCKKCGSHLGHVFEDGPTPTGKRYCINSTSLDFKNKKDTEA